MPRLRILLLLLWYYSITKASTTDVSENKPIQQLDNGKSTKDQWNYSDTHRHIENTRCETSDEQKTNDAAIKTKREINEFNDNEDATTKDKRPEKNRRKIGPDYLDVVDTDESKYLIHLANLISKYRGKYVQYGFVVGRAEDIIDLDMIRRCMHPVEIPKHFSPWLGKRGTRFQDTIQKKCLDTLVQPVNYRPESYPTDDGKVLKPFRPWGGKRDNGEAKKTNFGAWGGKRGSDRITAPKKSQFRAWGGKRLADLFGPPYPHIRQTNSDSVDRKSRDAKFSAWGGKRASAYPIDPTYPFLYGPDNTQRQSRDSTFSAWGGKRSDDHSMLDESQENMERQSRDAKFSAWGGKRNFAYPLDPIYPKLPNDIENIERFTRDGKFNAWGGKRDPEYPLHPTYPKLHQDLENMDRESRDAKFSAWGGKRSILVNPVNVNMPDVPPEANLIDELIVPTNDGVLESDNDYPLDELFLTRNRINVQSMGNIASIQERLLPSDFEELNEKFKEAAINPNKVKRNFSAWGGKRAEQIENEDYAEQKRKFGMWGGKRSQISDVNDSTENSQSNELANNTDTNLNEMDSSQKVN